MKGAQRNIEIPKDGLDFIAYWWCSRRRTSEGVVQSQSQSRQLCQLFGRIEQSHLLWKWNTQSYEACTSSKYKESFITPPTRFASRWFLIWHKSQLNIWWVWKGMKSQLTMGIGKVIRLVGLIQLFILIRHLYLSGGWFSADLRTDIKRHMFQRDWNMYSKFVNHYRLNSHYDWWGEDLVFLWLTVNGLW